MARLGGWSYLNLSILFFCVVWRSRVGERRKGARLQEKGLLGRPRPPTLLLPSAPCSPAYRGCMLTFRWPIIREFRWYWVRDCALGGWFVGASHYHLARDITGHGSFQSRPLSLSDHIAQVERGRLYSIVRGPPHTVTPGSDPASCLYD